MPAEQRAYRGAQDRAGRMIAAAIYFAAEQRAPGAAQDHARRAAALVALDVATVVAAIIATLVVAVVMLIAGAVGLGGGGNGAKVLHLRTPLGEALVGAVL